MLQSPFSNNREVDTAKSPYTINDLIKTIEPFQLPIHQIPESVDAMVNCSQR